MTYDLLIKNGTVVDGSGMPSHRTDIGIKNGKIVALGRLQGAAQVIDAEDKVVAPGFVDIHTHYDAQILWDPLLTGSPWFGVTTVVMGNCGFSLAPCAPQDRDYLTRMFARVEGVNFRALTQGLDWTWQSFPEYLLRLEKQRLGVNVGTTIGHSAVRRRVLGNDASSRSATREEIGRMKALVREGMAAGAFGFSTSQFPGDVDGDGNPVPSRLATTEEILELGSTLSEFSIGSIGIITENAVSGLDQFTPAEENLMTALSVLSGRPVNWNSLRHTWDRPNAWRNHLRFMERAAEAGAQVYSVAKVHPLDRVFSLRTPTVFDGWPKWKEVLAQPHPIKMGLLRNPDVRNVLRTEAMARDAAAPIWNRLERAVFLRSKSGQHAQFHNMALSKIGLQTGGDAIEVLLRWSVDEDLQADFAMVGVQNGDLDAVGQFIQSPFAVPGISDAGAHTDRQSNLYYTAYMLGHWVRDARRMSIEEAVRRLTFVPAVLYGIRDRGLLQTGMAADVVIFDLPKIGWSDPEWIYDFPGGEGRVVNHARGIDYVIVNGKIVFQDGRPSGELPGRLLRSSAHMQRGDGVP